MFDMVLDLELRIYDNVSMERKRRDPRRFIVQAILPRDVYKWLQDSCAREGLSTSSWLRRLVMMERRADKATVGRRAAGQAADR
jgi:hypothetical protein